MLILQNQTLRVQLLDPVLDQKRLGSRYCTGGYVWQISDLISGDLLSGPQFPDPVPTKFDGQGVPEVFETAMGQDSASINEEVLVIGVGRVIRTSPVQPFHVRDNPEVSEFCSWEIRQNQNSVLMQTKQNFKNFSLNLIRIVSLNDRTVTSSSVLINTGKESIPLRWFAHPFFPLNKDFVCCKFSRPIQTPQKPGFLIDKNGYLVMSRDYPWSKGLYCPLQMEWGEPLSVKQHHPLLSEINVQLSFPVFSMPVWANANTFSFEPYLDTLVLPGSRREWAIEYRF